MGEDTTITTRADVYTQEIPSTSNSVMMMSSGDSSPPTQASISTANFDTLDHARLGKTAPAPTAKISKPTDSDAEAIEEATPIVQTTPPAPESAPKIEMNGYDTKKEEPVKQTEDDACLINCIYVTQQCCECIIV